MSSSPARIVAASIAANPTLAAGSAAAIPGLRVVLPGEDYHEVANRVAAVADELAIAGSPMSLALAQRAALLMIRSERCCRHDAALAAERVRNAQETFDQNRKSTAAHLLDWIGQDPANNYRLLVAMPEGIDLLLATMRTLRLAALDQENYHWDDMCSWKFQFYCGRRPEDSPQSESIGFGDAIRKYDFSQVDPALGAGLSDPDRVAVIRVRQVELIDAEILRLEAFRTKIDYARIAADRAEACERALVGTDPTSLMVRKYEAATERSIQRALFEIRQLRKLHEDGRLANPVAVAEARASNAEDLPELAELNLPTMGSFGSGTIAPPRPRDAATITASQPPTRPQSRYPDRKKRPQPPR